MEQNLTIVVPALDAAASLGATLDACREAAGAEALVVDGGSRDATRAVARKHGACVLESAPGRGRQLALGAAAARGGWLLFLHADTRPAPGWFEAVRSFMAEPGAAEGRAAHFAFALDDPSPEARRPARACAPRC